MNRSPRAVVPVLGVLLALLLALPAAAYVVVLQDGSKIMAEEKYRVEGDRAIIELPNGTVTFIEVDQIDVEATEKANEAGYGKALVIEGGETRERGESDRNPAAERRRSLAELATRRESDRSRLEPQRRAAPDDGPVRKTSAGFVDLQTLPRRPFRTVELTSEVQRAFRGRGVDEVELYQGSQPDRVFAEITTASEASVFRALEVAADILLAIREEHAGEVGSFELLLATPDRQRAGQFHLTPEMARELTAEETQVAEFFVEYVEF